MSAERLSVVSQHLTVQKAPGTVNTHVLDTSRGTPADGLKLSLHKLTGSKWKLLTEGRINASGKCPEFAAYGRIPKGIYNMKFESGDYFQQRQIRNFHPYIEVMFHVENEDEFYLLPLLLSPHGYQTYRGS